MPTARMGGPKLFMVIDHSDRASGAEMVSNRRQDAGIGIRLRGIGRIAGCVASDGRAHLGICLDVVQFVVVEQSEFPRVE